MKVHHINCATFCPITGLIPGLGPKKLVCHCLLVETNDGLVLVDTGLGTDEMTHIGNASWQGFVFLSQPRFEFEETALHQIKARGYQARDVKHIILTHLDLDHAGGLRDFPRAKVHIYKPELEHATHPVTVSDKTRFQPRQWEHGPIWSKYSVAGEKWFGFEAVKELEGLPPEILMVPLIGHTLGHCGVAINTDSGWILHAGDAYYHHTEIDWENPSAPPYIRALNGMNSTDPLLHAYNQQRLRQLKHEHSEVRIFSAHDHSEFEACTR